MNFRFIGLVSTALAVLISYVPAAEPVSPREAFRIAGYLPDYRLADFPLEAAESLTDLILFSAEPTPEGELKLGSLTNAPWETLMTFKTHQRVRLILCIGGWNRSHGFASVSQSTSKRLLFAKAVVRFCLERRFDGVDLDWEHPANPEEEANYGKLLVDLRQEMKPHGLVLSLTMAGWQKVPLQGIDAVDWVQIMAYDHDGRHSTFEGARTDLKKILDQGVARQKIVLGLPFYGRRITASEQSQTYSELMHKHRPAPKQDEVEGFYFNGADTIQRKTKFARESKLAGVMVWELGQDTHDETSLLKAVHKASR